MELNNIDISSQVHNFKKYVSGRCFRPVKIRYFDVSTETYSNKNVPCGVCLHCVGRRQQDWVTRMSLESMEKQNTYFVTLTFDSNYLKKNLEYQSLLHCIDVDNSCLPLLLAKKPLQDFIKRLRFNTQKNIQYYACGEYGDTYGRPHYHMLIWTDDILSSDDIVSAWSLRGEQIGRIQFDNLRDNGTLNDLFRDDDSSSKPEDNSSKSAFKYCAKYCTKYYRNVFKLPTLKLIIDYYEKNIENKRFQKRFNISNCPVGDYKYETYREFLEEYKPFMVCSTKSPIGDSYFKRSVDKWHHEVPNKIESFGHEFITPAYAYNMWRDRIFPYRFASVKNPRSINISNPMVYLRDLLYICNVHSNRAITGIIDDNDLCRYDDFTCYNKVTKEYFVVNSRAGNVETWSYTRGFGYVQTSNLSLQAFFKEYSQSVVNYIALLRQNKQKNKEYLTKEFDALNDFLESNNISYDDFVKLHDDIVKSLENDFASRQKSYLAKKQFRNKYKSGVL